MQAPGPYELEGYLRKIVEGLPQAACLLKNGALLARNASFSESIDEVDFTNFLNHGDGNGYRLPYRSIDSLYSLTPLRLDAVYTFIFLVKVQQCSLITDPLTKVLHRESLDKVCHRLLEEAKFLNQSVAFLFIDLDGFKSVNDTWGHESGDLVLKATADRMSRLIRSKDYCFRMGGDEFLLVMSDIKDKMHCCLVARRLISSISAPVALSEGANAQIGASIGIAAYPEDGVELDALIQKADEAMYKAKRLGKNNYQLH